MLQGIYLIEDSANRERSPAAIYIYIIYMLWLYLAISAEYHTDDLLSARRISSALVLAILLSRIKPSLYNIYRRIVNTVHLVNDSGKKHLELSSNNNKPYPLFRPLPCHRFGLTFAVYAIILPDHYCPASKWFFPELIWCCVQEARNIDNTAVFHDTYSYIHISPRRTCQSKPYFI